MQHIEHVIIDNCSYININRPYIGNALSKQTIIELFMAFNSIKLSRSVQCIVLQASGSNFCTGIDLSWMHECANMPWHDNINEAQRIADLFYLISQINIPKLCITKGKVIGGGIGLVACCDLVIAEENTTFSLPELNLGIIPAIIMPYLSQAIGKRKAKNYALLTNEWGAKQALSDGLIYKIETPQNIEKTKDQIIEKIKSTPKESIYNFMKYNNNSNDLKNQCATSAGYLAKTRAELIAKNKIAEFLKKS